jgi:TonB family protein
LTSPVVKPTPATPTGAKTVRVQISYDEAGRVTQAAAIGTSPGAEAYAATAVRVARSRHFTPGKAGSTVVTIPIN